MSESELPKIYANTSVSLVSARIIASFPTHTFLENLAVAADGTLFISSHEAGQILQVSPEGESSVLASIEGKVTGVAFAPDGSLIVTGWDEAGVSVIWSIELDGKTDRLAALPDAMFLNGITPINAHQYLTADSYRGCIWQFDWMTKQTSIWLEHSLLARSSDDNPFPGANGIKRFGNTLYVSNTERMMLLKIPILSEQRAGEPTVFVSPTNIDDFAFDVAGNLYATTHIYNSILRITPEGETTAIAQADQGVIGSTAVAFGRKPTDENSLYVVTNGGMSLPPEGGAVQANVVRLEVGQSGYPLSIK